MQTELNKLIAALQEFYARETYILERDLGELKQRVERKSEEFAGLLDQALEGE